MLVFVIARRRYYQLIVHFQNMQHGKQKNLVLSFII